MLDHPKLINQLCGLERRTARGGKDSIDHAPGAHDDVANSVAGLAAINTKFGAHDSSFSWVSGDSTDDVVDSRTWRVQQLAGFLHGMVLPR